MLSATIKNEKDVELNSTKSNEKVGPFSCQAKLSVFFCSSNSLFRVALFAAVPPFNNGFGTPFIPF